MSTRSNDGTMTESLDQRARRIWNDIPVNANEPGSLTEHVYEFTCRLLAEQAGQEPTADGLYKELAAAKARIAALEATLADTAAQSQRNFDSWMEEVGKIHNLRKQRWEI